MNHLCLVAGAKGKIHLFTYGPMDSIGRTIFFKDPVFKVGYEVSDRRPSSTGLQLSIDGKGHIDVVARGVYNFWDIVKKA